MKTENSDPSIHRTMPPEMEDWAEQELEIFYPDPRKFCQSNEAQRLALFSLIDIPDGWVVDSGSPELWEVVNQGLIIPLKPGGNNLTANRQSERIANEMSTQYGEGTVFLAVPGEDCNPDGWLWGPVTLGDLKVEPQILMDRAYNAHILGDLQERDRALRARVALMTLDDRVQYLKSQMELAESETSLLETLQ